MGAKLLIMSIFPERNQREWDSEWLFLSFFFQTPLFHTKRQFPGMLDNADPGSLARGVRLRQCTCSPGGSNELTDD